MARASSHGSEVIGSVHDAPAEVTLPNPVGHYPRGQRMARVGNPLCEPRARTLHVRRKRRGVFRQQDAERSRVDGLEGLGVVAPGEQTDFRWVLSVIADGC